MATFLLLPAIDLRGGRVVRLRQGDFARETAYADDPMAVASAFVEAGAKWLHVVDLDGARSGRPAHAAMIRTIVAAVGERASVEVAGGLRSTGAVAEVLDAGAARAVVGTAALADPTFAAELVKAHGADRIAVALDVRDGLAVGAGWVPGASGTAIRTAIDRLAGEGVAWFEVTAIDRDGMMAGPDLELLALATGAGARVIASGGIRSEVDLRATRAIGCAGAIVGRALYDGTLELAATLRAISMSDGWRPPSVPVRLEPARDAPSIKSRGSPGT
jgi:phosphoribosylformimino-5-aminoimidazole carboxamide ribotide isomerase